MRLFFSKPSIMFAAAALVMLLSGSNISAAKTPQLKPLSKSNTGLTRVNAPKERLCDSPFMLENVEPNLMPVRGGPMVSSPSPYFTAKVLSIEIAADPSLCKADCRQFIERSALGAFALWRTGCARCGAGNNLILILINGNAWVDSHSLDIWRYAIAQGGPAGADPFLQTRLGPQPVTDFKRVDAALKAQVCAPASPLELPTGITNALCRSKQNQCKEQCVPTRISVGAKFSSCSLSPDVVGCGTPDREIGLNTDDYLFFDDVSDVTIGKGRRPALIDYVLAHEIGHWFGLVHVHGDTSVVNIMSDGYPKASADWCLPNALLWQLDEAVDLDARMTGNTSLRWRE